jgi:hypothetical protein
MILSSACICKKLHFTVDNNRTKRNQKVNSDINGTDN